MADARWSLLERGENPVEWWSHWDRLNDENFDGHPLLDARMVRLLLAHFGTAQTRLAALHDGTRYLALTAVVPSGLGGWRVFRPGQSPIGILVCDRAIANQGPASLRLLLRRLPGLGLALHVPCQDEQFSWLRGDHQGVHRALIGTTVAIRSAGSFDDYWSARSKELRDNVRRRTRRLADDGLTSTLDCIDDASKIGEAVDRYGELESRGWKGQAGSALHPTNRQGCFYRELLETFASSREGRVYELRLDGRLAASRLVISGRSMHIVLKTTHDEELRRYAPGHVQLHAVLRDLLSQPGGRSVELYTNAGRDWLLWSTHSRGIVDFTLYRNALVARAAAWRRRRQTIPGDDPAGSPVSKATTTPAEGQADPPQSTST